jgi:hypothetical protein
VVAQVLAGLGSLSSQPQAAGAGIQPASGSRSWPGLNLRRHRLLPFESSAARPPPGRARRHRSPVIRVTRKRLVNSRSLAPTSISCAAANRAVRTGPLGPVSPPPSGYLMHPA